MKLPSKHPTNDEDFSKLGSIGQENLIKHWSTLSGEQREQLTKEIGAIDVPLFRRQQETLLRSEKGAQTLLPFDNFAYAGQQENQSYGEQLVREGKVALLVLAGGQGSRLRFPGPKGFYTVTNVLNKSLYQLLAEKVAAASACFNRPLPVAIMTSPLNHAETIHFFTDHHFFGLAPSQVTFFNQQMWPFLNFEGDLFLEEVDQIAKGPNGNGGVFRHLVESHIWEKWNAMGIEIVNIVPIDNPLGSPFDGELFGFHAHHNNDITMKAAWRRSPLENVGVLALVEGKAAVVEYSELDASEKEATEAAGNLKFGIANLGLYSFSLDFIGRVSTQKLPLHCAKKAVKMLGADGKSTVPLKPNAWKFEEFIFDTFLFANKVEALLFPRQSCFAPLKNLHGEDSIDTVQAALLAYDREIFAKVTGNKPPQNAVFELSPQFYYPTEKLIEKWRGKHLPNQGYIHE